MHNCQKIEERLIDLVFNELNEDQRRQTLAEVESCDHCRAEYQAMTTTLSVVDQASKAMMPDEQYWNGYESRLRAKLAADEQPALWQRLIGTFSAWMTQPVWAGAVALLLCAALLLWLVLAKTTHTVNPPELANKKPQTITPDNSPKEKESGDIGELKDAKEKPSRVQPKLSPQQNKLTLHQPGIVAVQKKNPALHPEKIDNLTQPQTPVVGAIVEETFPGASPGDNETLKHFEKAQLFLRGFRNLDSTESTAATEIADDKQRSRTLLFKNVLLRREAETKGNLPVGQVLNDLEPLLIDIANLSDKATPDDIRTIQERVQKREIIATLQVYAARPLIAKAVTD